MHSIVFDGATNTLTLDGVPRGTFQIYNGNTCPHCPHSGNTLDRAMASSVKHLVLTNLNTAFTVLNNASLMFHDSVHGVDATKCSISVYGNTPIKHIAASAKSFLRIDTDNGALKSHARMASYDDERHETEDLLHSESKLAKARSCLCVHSSIPISQVTATNCSLSLHGIDELSMSTSSIFAQGGVDSVDIDETSTMTGKSGKQIVAEMEAKWTAALFDDDVRDIG